MMFNTMFHSGFQEGLQVESQLQSPQVVALPEQEPQPLLDLCYIMHNKHEEVSDIDYLRFIKIFTQAHFRGALQAIKGWASDVLEGVIGDSIQGRTHRFGNDITHGDLLVLAYNFDFPSLFRIASTACFYHEPAGNVHDLHWLLDSWEPLGLFRRCIYYCFGSSSNSHRDHHHATKHCQGGDGSTMDLLFKTTGTERQHPALSFQTEGRASIRHLQECCFESILAV